MPTGTDADNMHDRLIASAQALGATSWQAETLAYLTRGYSMKVAGARMALSRHTVRDYATQGRHRLDAANLREAGYLIMAQYCRQTRAAKQSNEG